MGATKPTSSKQQNTTTPLPAVGTRHICTPKRKRNVHEQTTITSTSAKRTCRNRSDHPVASPGMKAVIDLTGDSPVTSLLPIETPRAKIKPSPDEGKPERRARVFRRKAPQTFLQRLNRAMTQRMFVLGHTVTGADDVPEMRFDIAGTTGNIYQTVIGKEPTCTCPDARKGNQCKHICYVLVNVLKAPEHLQYQLAFLSMELREMYEGSSLSREKTKCVDNNGVNRKAVDGECPICFMEFEPDKEEIVWCQATCGTNVHKACFQQWAITTRSQGVRCVYCRSPWQTDTSDVSLKVKQLREQGQTNEEGYINVASQLGLSRLRDYSTYHPFWVSQQSYPYGSRSGRRVPYRSR
ncbi:RING finger domain protein [Aspergillus bertholletiae]|uniref:RING finger domain protein n=1 Tax=Aspergillus bertholletiae TaxID=1226010 RepID=A0A5N7ANX6_9EURO|nr:RING finger domain protein [Aspergillus bertholletiae]